MKMSSFRLKIIHKSKNQDGLKLGERRQSTEADNKTEMLEFSDTVYSHDKKCFNRQLHTHLEHTKK